MSTATGPNSGYADCDEFISHRLKAARTRIKRTDLLTASLLAGVLLIGYVLVFTILDHWVVDGGFSATTRATLLSLVVGLCLGIVYRYVIRPWTQQIHPLYAAKVLDESDEDMNGTLLSLVDLDSTDSAATDAIRRTMEKRAAVRLSEVSVDEAIDRGWLMNLSVTLFVLVLTTCIYAVFSPKTINLLRPLSLSSAAVATQTRILRVQPGETTVQAGGELEVVAVVGGSMPDAIHVLYSTEDQTYVDEVFTMSATDEDGRFRVSLVGDGDRGLRQNFTYQVVAGDARSDVFAVTVDQPPTCSVIETSYQYPAYMGLPDRTTQNGNLDCWKGTRVSIVAEATTPVRLALLQFSEDASFANGDVEIDLSIDGTRLSGELQLDLNKDAPKFYRIVVTDLDGRTDPQPTVYSVNVREDQPPVVRLLDPARDMRVPANAVVPLLIEAEDPDFLLRSVDIKMVVNNDRDVREFVFDGQRAQPTSRWSGIYDLELRHLRLQEGDVVRYHIAAKDNKTPVGGVSRTGDLQLFIERPETEQSVEQRRREDREALERRMQQEVPQEQDADPAADTEPSADDPNQKDADDPTAAGNPGEQVGGADTENGTMENGTMENGGGENGSENAGGEKTTDKPGVGDDENSNQPGTGSSAEGGEPNDQPADSGSDAEADKGTPGTESNRTTAGEGQSPSGTEPSERGRSGEPGERLTDDEAMQQLLDAYKDAIENADPSDSEAVTDSTDNTPAGESRNDADNGAGDAASGAVDDRSRQDAATTGASEDSVTQAGSDSEADKGLVDPSSDQTDPSTNGDDRNQTGEPGAEQGDPNKTGEPGAEQGDPNKTGEPGTEQGDPNKTGEPGTEQGDPNKTGEPGTEQGDPNKTGEPGTEQGDPNKTGEPGTEQGDPNKTGEPGAEQDDPNKTGESDKQSGESDKQSGEGGKQSGEGGKQSGEGGKQSGEGGKQSGEGGKQSGEGGKQSGEGGKQSGEGGKQSGEGGKQSGEGGKQSGEGGKQSGEGGKQSGEGGKQSGEGGKQSGEGGKQSSEGGKQSGEGGKQSGEGGKQSGEGGKQSGEGGKQSGEGGKQAGEGGKQAGKEGGQGGKSPQRGGAKGKSSGGGNPAGGMGEGSGPGKQSGGDEQGGPQAGAGNGKGGNKGDADFKPDKANVEDAAQAADLVLKRLQKDLDRGQVDKKLLEKLGWTESELEAFRQRMQQQLSRLDDESTDQSRTEQRQRRRVEELLKSLDLKSKSQGRTGRTDRDREVQNTSSRQTAPPSRYRDQMQLYERSLSEGRRR